jgi:hypothetical protein
LIFSHILANHNNIIYGYDINNNVRIKIKKNQKDNEPYLNTLIKKNRKKFFFLNNFSKAVKETNSAFIIVPTPSKKNHEFNNAYIIKALDNIGKFLGNFIKDFLSGLGVPSNIGNFVGDTVNAITSAIGNLLKFVTDQFGSLVDVFSGKKSIGQFIIDFVGGMFTFLGDQFNAFMTN